MKTENHGHQEMFTRHYDFFSHIYLSIDLNRDFKLDVLKLAIIFHWFRYDRCCCYRCSDCCNHWAAETCGVRNKNNAVEEKVKSGEKNLLRSGGNKWEDSSE